MAHAASLLLASLALAGCTGIGARRAADVEVRQIVSFQFSPGQAAEALALYRNQALPLYEQDEAMLSFRAFREVESPVPLDLVIVRSFEGMAGMDASSAFLRSTAERGGQSIGTLYGRIGALSASHDDQFVEVLGAFANGEPESRRLVAFVWYALQPGEARRFERTLQSGILRWEQAHDIPSSTSRFLLSDGWHYLRVVGLDSLGAYQDYWAGVASAGHDAIDRITARRREALLKPLSELSIR